MGWIIVIGVIALFIALIFFVPYGIGVRYDGESVFVTVRAWFLRFRVFPRKPLTEKQKARKEEKKQKKKQKKEKETSESLDDPKNTSEKVKKKSPPDPEFLLALLKMGIHAIRRFFRSFTVDLFRLHLIVASPDPYDTAIRYGSICSAVEALPELCGNRIRVLRRDIEIGSDYLAERPAFTGEIVITLQLFRLVHMAVAFAAEFLIWKIKNRRSSAHEHRKEG